MTSKRMEAINRKTRILRLAAQGHTLAVIAEFEGCTNQYVSYVLKQAVVS